MQCIARSEELVGYPVRIMPKEAFKVTGHTIIVAPDADKDLVHRFWNDVAADGRLARLQAASSVPTWVLGLGSWDPECAKRGFRYTVCIEETAYTDSFALAQEQSLYTCELGASDWMCFEMTEEKYDARFWKDGPYRMMKPLGHRFNGRVGVRFDAYPPAFSDSHSAMEFWISVAPRRVPGH